MLAKQLAQRMNCFHFEKSNCYPQNSKKISNKENSLDVRFPPPTKKKKKKSTFSLLKYKIETVIASIT